MILEDLAMLALQCGYGSIVVHTTYSYSYSYSLKLEQVQLNTHQDKH